MAVLQHEGTIEILYRDFAMPTGARFTTGYLARPDRIGAYPLVVLLPPLRGITPYVKDLARRLARNRYAVLVPDLTRGAHPGSEASFEDLVAAYRRVRARRAIADIDDALAFAFNDSAGWAREGKVGVIGIDVGGRFAITYAAYRQRQVGALCVAYAPLAGDEDRRLKVADALEMLPMRSWACTAHRISWCPRKVWTRPSDATRTGSGSCTRGLATTSSTTIPTRTITGRRAIPSPGCWRC